eukprot:10348620-Prorocentrum_lima.AAC.1
MALQPFSDSCRGDGKTAIHCTTLSLARSRTPRPSPPSVTPGGGRGATILSPQRHLERWSQH